MLGPWQRRIISLLAYCNKTTAHHQVTGLSAHPLTSIITHPTTQPYTGFPGGHTSALGAHCRQRFVHSRGFGRRPFGALPVPWGGACLRSHTHGAGLASAGTGGERGGEGGGLGSRKDALRQTYVNHLPLHLAPISSLQTLRRRSQLSSIDRE